MQLCLLGNFVLSSADFFQNQLFRKILLGVITVTVSNNLDPDQARQNVGPDLGPNCLQRISADHTRINFDLNSLMDCRNTS